MSETLQQNLPLAVVGLLIVFTVQTIIAMTISGLRQLDEKWRFQEKADNAEALDREPTVDATTVVLVSAAAATVLRGRFRIRSIRRLMPASVSHSGRSRWNRIVIFPPFQVDLRHLRRLSPPRGQADQAVLRRPGQRPWEHSWIGLRAHQRGQRDMGLRAQPGAAHHRHIKQFRQVALVGFRQADSDWDRPARRTVTQVGRINPF